MIIIKSPAEIEIMAQGGQIAAQVLAEVIRAVRPGVTTLSLERLASQRIGELRGRPSFQGFEGYPFTTCINVNEGIVHGLPGDYPIRVGDLVSVDLGVFYQGFHSDVAWTVLVGLDGLDPGSDACPPGRRGLRSGVFFVDERARFLSAGKEALRASLNMCRAERRIGDISSAMQRVVEAAGYQVVRDLVGHGVGRQLHEPPAIPCFGQPGRGQKIKVGMVLAVEVIYVLGNYKLKVLPDGWTMTTRDGRISALFEQTDAVTP